MGGSKHDAYFGRERGGALQHDGTEARGQFSGINFIFSFFRISILSNFGLAAVCLLVYLSEVSENPVFQAHPGGGVILNADRKSHSDSRD
jgi:hypothetical protein